MDTEYPQGTAAGEYRFTPGFSFVFAPGWADVEPFVLQKSSQFRPDPPYKVTSRKYAEDFNEIKALGGDGVTTPSARLVPSAYCGKFQRRSQAAIPRAKAPTGWPTRR